MRNHNRPQSCPDEDCNYAAPDYRGIERHIRSVHRPQMERFGVEDEGVTCPDCGNHFTRRDNFTRHKNDGRCRRG